MRWVEVYSEAEELVERGHALRRVRGEGHAEEGRPRDAGDAVRPVRHLVPVEQDDADDLAEAERDDRQVVAAQPQHRKAEREPETGGEGAGHRQALPEAEAEMRRYQRVAVGADRVEGDVAEVEQPGEADHDVEAPAQHHVSEHEDAEIEPVAVDEGPERPGRRQDQQQAGDAELRRAAEAPGPLPDARGRPADPPESVQREMERQAPDEHHGDRDRHPAPALLQPDALVRAGPGADADEVEAEHRRGEDERDQRRDRRILEDRRQVQRGRVRRFVGSLDSRHAVKPSRLRACRAARSAGRSAPSRGWRRPPRPCIRR